MVVFVSDIFSLMLFCRTKIPGIADTVNSFLVKDVQHDVAGIRYKA